MDKKLQFAIILFAILPILIFLPACSKKTAETDASDVTVQEEDMEAQKVREQLAKERQERETKARELRAEKIKFMWKGVVLWTLRNWLRQQESLPMSTGSESMSLLLSAGRATAQPRVAVSVVHLPAGEDQGSGHEIDLVVALDHEDLEALPAVP